MNYEQTVRTFGKISVQLVVALSMQAENIQRQNLGQSVAYTEEQFGVVADMIETLLEELK